jgi:uncharacterized protein YndB with AHSA1/START domain
MEEAKMPDLTGQTREAVVLERTLPVPPDMLWPLWTEPARFAAWYGPAGATVTVLAMDVRVGGERRVSMSMVTPGGERVMHFAGAHLEVERPRRLAYTEAVVDSDDAQPHGAPTEVHVMFENHDAGTRLTLTHLGIPAGSPGEAGWSMALDKLIQAVSPA